jgi:hypothetical protein
MRTKPKSRGACGQSARFGYEVRLLHGEEGGELLKVHDTIAVEVGGVVHLGHYSTKDGMIRVTYGSSCKATQLGGMENAPKALARMILAEQVREALGHNEGED